jgi:cytochrome b561
MLTRDPRLPDSLPATGAGVRHDLEPRYDTLAKLLHWVIAALLVAQYILAWLMPHIGSNTPPDRVINLHFSFGILILALMAVRLIYRRMRPVPLSTVDSPAWERAVAVLTHRVFYLTLLLGPFLGWASASAHGIPVVVFGLLPLPGIAMPHAGWALLAGDIHTWSMWALLGLIALHAAAALYHHFFRHDGVLRRMTGGTGGSARST